VRNAWADNSPLSSCIADTRQWLSETSDGSSGASNFSAASDASRGGIDGDGAVGGSVEGDTPAVGDNIKAFIEVFLEFADDHLSLDPDATAGAFFTALRSDDRVLGTRDGVELTTFHGAKGQEWPVVYLVGLEDGYVPIHHARTSEARAEEQRLLHVAITRAQQELHLLWCNQRQRGDKIFQKEPSPWVTTIAEGIQAESSQVDHVAAVARAREMLRSQRDKQH